jgi:surface protein
MYAMFFNCWELKSLNLSNFDTSSVINMQQMFASCTSLTSLDINNFNTSNVENMKGMFSDCNSLISLNLINFDTSKLNTFSDMFLNIKNNIVYCINEEKESTIISLLSNFSTNNNCTDSSFLKSGQKFIFEKKIFIDNCTKDNI